MIAKKTKTLLFRTCAFLAPALLLALSSPAQASLAWGSINNFDTVNDTGGECHGFEIEIDDIHSKDITYTYNYNHYGTPKITEDNTDPLHSRVFIRYESAKKLDGTWASFTAVPSGPITPTQGHQFTNPSVNFGGEHFGVGYYGTTTAVKYNWLKDDGFGNLVYAGAVNISTPAFTYIPPAPAAPAQVQAAIVPPPEVPIREFGEASWVKEIRTSSHNNNKVELRDLVSDDPHDPNFKSWKNGEPDEVEVEWQVLQKDFNAANGGANGELVGAPEGLANGDEVITRRYEFYKYVGPFDPETGEALAQTVAADGIHGTGAYAGVVIIGDYIGAQMAGFDAAAKIGLVEHLQDGEINLPYVERSIVIGGTAPITTTWTGVLPDGITFDTVSGVLSGTPTATGTFTFTVHSVDSAGGDVSRTYNLTINDAGAVPFQHFTLNTKVAPAAGGTTSGDGEYVGGTAVTLVATPAPGYIFSNWTDGGAIVSTSSTYSFPLNVNRDLVANFVPGNAIAITSLTPASALRGALALTDVIKGTGFASGVIVQFNGTNLTTTFVSSTQLKAAIPATLLKVPGVYPVQITAMVGGVLTASAPAYFTVNNPTPALTKVSPSAAATGTAFTLTVTGTGFVKESQVAWNGNLKATTYVNSTTLTIHLTAADTLAGTASVQVNSPTPGGGSSNTLGLLIADPVVSVSYTITRVTASQVKLSYTVTNTGSVKVTNLKQTKAKLALSSPSLSITGSPSTALLSAALAPGQSVKKSVTFTSTRLTTGTSAVLTLTVGADGGYVLNSGGSVVLP